MNFTGLRIMAMILRLLEMEETEDRMITNFE